MSEEISRQYHVRRREFLNQDPDLPAFIIGIVEDTRAIPDEEGWDDGQISLDLADCYRRVSFNFDMYDAGERAKSLRKISLIAEVVNAVRDGIAAEVESRNARPPKAADASAIVDLAPEEVASPLVENTRVHFWSFISSLGL